MYRKADLKSSMSLLLWAMTVVLFSTLCRVSHVVVSPHTLLRGDVKFCKSGILVTIHSSKTKKMGKPTKIPISYGRDRWSCLVYWLGKLFENILENKITIYSLSTKFRVYLTNSLKALIVKAGIRGNFSTHSLIIRRGGTTSLHQ